MKYGKAELHILKLTSVHHHHPSVGPKQLNALVHQGWYFLNLPYYNFSYFQNTDEGTEVITKIDGIASAIEEFKSVVGKNGTNET